MEEDRIRSHAYQLWQAAGCPDGRDEEFWEKAKELVAIEDNQKLALKKVNDYGESQPWDEPVEPPESIENQGEFPGLADQGDEQPRTPHFDQDTASGTTPRKNQ